MEMGGLALSAVSIDQPLQQLFFKIKMPFKRLQSLKQPIARQGRKSEPLV
jgi:hypothetical protein